MKRLALWVEFELKPGAMPAFLTAARNDATGSVTREPGCRRFDVLVDPQRTDRVCFYEVYDDEAAYIAHRELPHYAEFRILADPWTRSRRVLTYNGVVLSSTA